MDPDQTARMRRLVWIHAGRKPIMLFFVVTWLILRLAKFSQPYVIASTAKKSSVPDLSYLFASRINSYHTLKVN
jgi:hypothetical protein